MKPFLTFRILCFLAIVTTSADSQQRFERTYSPQHPAHLTISNVNGSIHISAWDKKSILARATASSSVAIEDHVIGDDITIMAKKSMRLARADFVVNVPADTSLTVKNIVGKIDVRGITGHVSIHSIDSDVQLAKVNSSSVDVIVTSG